MNKLPPEIILIIYKFLNIKEISKIKHLNKNLYYKCINLEDCTFSNEINNLNKNLKKNIILSILKNFINTSIQTYHSYLIQTYNPRYVNKIFKGYLLYNSYNRYFTISKNYIVNHMFNDILHYYIKHNEIENYPNQITLFVLYLFIQIDYYKNTNYVNYYLKFLNTLDTFKFKNLLCDYYFYILITNVPITFDQMYQLSPFVITVPVLKKIMSYKVLDLQHTHLINCCYNCIPSNIKDICKLKLNFWNNDLISHNYIQIKNLLKKQNPLYFNCMSQYEDCLLNKVIYIKNPNSNKRIKINSQIYYSMLENNKYLEQYIISTRNKLRQKFFT